MYNSFFGFSESPFSLSPDLLVTAYAMEQHTVSVAMLDEVCRDMRLEWPGSNRDRRERASYRDASETPFTTGD